MTEMPDARWTRGATAAETACTVWTSQLAAHWFSDDAWSRTRDALDLSLFRNALSGRRKIVVRRLVLYDPPSDVGGTLADYQRVKIEHERWLARLRRQLAVLGPHSSAGDVPGEHDYRVRQVILPRAGRRTIIIVPDGIWTDCSPPAAVSAGWDAAGLIPLDPHEENIVGPHGDRNPLWAGT